MSSGGSEEGREKTNMAKLIHPYDQLTGGAWLRGNLHTHTTRSDGARAPQVVIDDYAARGYGFLMLSDHDILTSEADLARLDARGMVLIPGNEIAGGSHLLHVDADRHVATRQSRQEILHEIQAACRETGRGFAIMNHPDWESKFEHCTIDQLREWSGYLGIEIYNGVVWRLDGSSYATRKWDLLLGDGRRVLGFANDDCHKATGDIELGWNVAYVRERTRAGVVDALRQGRFYCSTGVVIRSISVDGMKVRIETENASRIVAIQNVGRRIAMVDDPAMEIEVPEAAKYVRFECWGQGERMAWTQAFYVERGQASIDPNGPRPITEWRVTPLAPGATIGEASLEMASGLPSTPLQANPLDSLVPGFIDARPQIQGQGGVLYLTTTIASEADVRGVLRLGYDGPIRVWLNGESIFGGPGSNPAIPDQLKLYGRFRRGANALVIALDSNFGNAWGIFARVDLKKG